MLRGSYTAKMDEKGRLKVPADFKRHLEESYKSADFYVTSLTGESVWIYPLTVWEEKEEKLNQAPSMEPAVRKFIDRVSYFGQQQQMDAQGRILIHQLLRNAAELVGEVMVMGKTKYLEVWESEKFRTSRLLAEPYTDEDAKVIAQFGI